MQRFEQLEAHVKENFSKFLDKATFRKFNAENHRDIANLKIKLAQIPIQKYSKKQRHWFDKNKIDK
jgi:selenocysteine-specific translation elongation factor